MKKLKYIGPLPLPRKVSIKGVLHEIDASGNVSGNPDPSKAESMVEVAPESWKFVECEAPAKKEAAPAKKPAAKAEPPKKAAPKKAASKKPFKKK